MAFNLNIERKETINKCVRFPSNLVKEIDAIANENNIAFSKFVIQACEYALKNMEKEIKKEKVKN